MGRDPPAVGVKADPLAIRVDVRRRQHRMPDDGLDAGVAAGNAPTRIREHEADGRRFDHRAQARFAFVEARARFVLARAVGEDLQVAARRTVEVNHQPGAPEARPVTPPMPALLDRAFLRASALHLLLGHRRGAVLGGEENRRRLADRFFAREADDPFGGAVPRGDHPALVECDDGDIERALDDLPQAGLARAQIGLCAGGLDGVDGVDRRVDVAALHGGALLRRAIARMRGQRLGAGAEHPGDRAVRIANRRQRDGVRCCGTAVGRGEHRLDVNELDRPAAANLRHALGDAAPVGCLEHSQRGTAGGGMHFADERDAALVVDEDAVRAPDEKHRQARAEHQLERRAQRLGPGRAGAERTERVAQPVHQLGAHPRRCSIEPSMIRAPSG